MTEKRFLPSHLMAEPSEPLAVLLELDGYFYQIAEQIREEETTDSSE